MRYDSWVGSESDSDILHHRHSVLIALQAGDPEREYVPATITQVPVDMYISHAPINPNP
ncbi:hypothetical protein SERLA73DRAFT_171437 [Serpula lacrymans var. lacrymans S7.3]|uniref:Uncharacterized protein n=2 Tax=Serpula lacrymans var. lacrymans TaxID=341189 RepID=F8QB48_SERL3|nr:uncharacterized protein SERLADRAFT_478416 [Serpula lacrymans var. lacrymans S7.9]EGN94434.1 hypothetical protein SERLA73DRAFT_171437 [Serpula lacrymans var. lacrymans S7.3]EGO19921.1 hypothetical protein SERLADRAFT_478416 [Serpula lacrymans var. lacrymans S7.9]